MAITIRPMGLDEAQRVATFIQRQVYEEVDVEFCRAWARQFMTADDGRFCRAFVAMDGDGLVGAAVVGIQDISGRQLCLDTYWAEAEDEDVRRLLLEATLAVKFPGHKVAAHIIWLETDDEGNELVRDVFGAHGDVKEVVIFPFLDWKGGATILTLKPKS